MEKKWAVINLFICYQRISNLTLQIFGTIAVSPLGSGLYCKTQREMIEAGTFDDTWDVLTDYDVYDGKLRRNKIVEYQDWNVRTETVTEDGEDDEFQAVLKFHR